MDGIRGSGAEKAATESALSLYYLVLTVVLWVVVYLIGPDDEGRVRRRIGAQKEA